MEWCKALVGPVVTIVGFFINYNYTKKMVKNEIAKKQINMSIDNLKDIPSDLLNILDDYKEVSLSNTFKNGSWENKRLIDEKRDKTFNKIFTYGSNDATRICTELQVFSNNVDKQFVEKIFVYYILLFCQVKYDLTGIKTNPDHWYKCKLYKAYIYDEGRKYKDANNEIVRQLSLPEFLIVK